MNKPLAANTVVAAARRTFLAAFAGLAASVLCAGESIGAEVQNIAQRARHQAVT